MTREEAIKELQSYAEHSWGDLNDAFEMAISALRQQEHFRDLTKKVGPLTLDELREMDGEPVWCVSLGANLSRGNGWYIGVNNWIMNGYGKTWLAYLQKPEEVQK